MALCGFLGFCPGSRFLCRCLARARVSRSEALAEQPWCCSLRVLSGSLGRWCFSEPCQTTLAGNELCLGRSAPGLSREGSSALGKRVRISWQPALLSKTLFLFYEAAPGAGSVGGESFARVGDHAAHTAVSASSVVSTECFCMLCLASALLGEEERLFSLCFSRNCAMIWFRFGSEHFAPYPGGLLLRALPIVGVGQGTVVNLLG